MILDSQVLEAALARFEAEYIDPEKAARAAAEIRRAAAAGEYAQLDGAAACAAVTKVFFTVCQDKHLRLLWSEEPEPLEEEDEEAGAAMFAALSREHNNGVRKVEILDGGIGYVGGQASVTGRTAAGRRLGRAGLLSRLGSGPVKDL